MEQKEIEFNYVDLNSNHQNNLKMSSHDLLELHSSVVAKKYGIPTYLEVPFITSLSEVKRLIKDNINKRALMNATKSTQSSTALINEYKKSHKCYYPVKLERSFSKAYNAIVNAADQTMFDTLLQLERTYAQTVETIRNEKQKELDDLKIRQMFELQRVDESDVNMKIYFKDKHLEELIVLERKLRTEVVEVYASQKNEYRDFVNKVYEELITREAESNQKSPQKTEVTEPGVLRLKRNSFINVGETSQEGISISALKKLDKKPSMEMLAALCNNNDVERQENTNSFPVIEQIPNSDQEFANMIANIQEMGFSFEQAEASLDLSSKNLQAAINLLLEKSNVVDRHIPVVRQKKEKHKKIYSDGDFGKRRYPEALKKSSSMLKLRSNSTDSFNSNSSTPPDSPSSKRAFSARSYLQQQQQLQQHKSLSSSNSNNSQTKTLKKMTSFLGKAMEALGLEDSEVRATVKGEIAKLSSNDEYLSESFTIYLGTQVRTMYNLRLIASKSYSDIFTLKLQSPEQELALRAQTANSLYMHDLSGVIVFLTKEDFKMYAKGFSANKEFIEKCKMSTEFHFESIEDQLLLIEKKLKKDDKGEPHLTQGDFFITKHSNIPNIHIVFHLIVDQDCLNVNNEVTSQSKLIVGYRSILKTSQLCDIHHLTIPLLLLPESIVKRIDAKVEQIVYKRSELVLKATKGLIMEHSRGLKHHNNESGGIEKFARSLVFVLPFLMGESQEGYSKTRVCFGAVREKLTDIFRTQ